MTAGGVAIVTGGSSGIGLACATTLRDLGFRVWACSRRGAPAAGAGIETVACDVTDREAVRAFVERAAAGARGGIDVLVTSAGSFPPRAPLDATDDGDWDDTLAVNLTGVYNVLRAALPHLRLRQGYVFLIGSVYGTHGLRHGAAYAAAKWGALGLHHSLLQEHEDHGVRATAILPGVVATPMVGSDPPAGSLQAADVARSVRYCLELGPDALVREIRLERAARARVDIEAQETAPRWALDLAAPGAPGGSDPPGRA